MKSGYHPQVVAEQMVAELKERTGGTGGIVLISPDGKIGSAYSTHLMVRALISEEAKVEVLD